MAAQNIIIKISKEHLEVIDKELSRLHELLMKADDEKRIQWAQDRISKVQDGLVHLRDLKPDNSPDAE